ncbi:MAG: hypothetical protein AAF358_19080 [Pseudomonadota bacterium]
MLIEYDNNTARIADGQIDDIMLLPSLDFGINRQGSRLDIEAFGLVEHASYVDDTFDSEFRGTVSANATYRVVESRLNWVVQNGLTRSNINVLGVQTPDNVQQTYAFATGPDLTLNLSAADTLVLGARYNFFDADDDAATTDSDGVGVFGQWSRSLTPTSTLGLSLQTSTIGFDQEIDLQPDYERRQVTANYIKEIEGGAGQSSSIAIDVGYAEAALDGAEDVTSPYFSMRWSRQLTGGEDLGVVLTREIGDVFADTLSFGNAVVIPQVQETVVTRDPFVRSSLGVNWTKDITDRHNLTALLVYDEQDYDTSLLDQELIRASVGLQWQISPLVSLSTAVQWANQTFAEAGQESDNLDWTFAVTVQRTRNIFLSFGFHYTDESNNIQNLEFDTLAARASVTYRR